MYWRRINSITTICMSLVMLTATAKEAKINHRPLATEDQLSFNSLTTLSEIAVDQKINSIISQRILNNLNSFDKEDCLLNLAIMNDIGRADLSMALAIRFLAAKGKKIDLIPFAIASQKIWRGQLMGIAAKFSNGEMLRAMQPPVDIPIKSNTASQWYSAAIKEANNWNSTKGIKNIQRMVVAVGQFKKATGHKARDLTRALWRTLSKAEKNAANDQTKAEFLELKFQLASMSGDLWRASELAMQLTYLSGEKWQYSAAIIEPFLDLRDRQLAEFSLSLFKESITKLAPDNPMALQQYLKFAFKLGKYKTFEALHEQLPAGAKLHGRYRASAYHVDRACLSRLLSRQDIDADPIKFKKIQSIPIESLNVMAESLKPILALRYKSIIPKATGSLLEIVESATKSMQGSKIDITKPKSPNLKSGIANKLFQFINHRDWNILQPEVSDMAFAQKINQENLQHLTEFNPRFISREVRPYITPQTKMQAEWIVSHLAKSQVDRKAIRIQWAAMADFSIFPHKPSIYVLLDSGMDNQIASSFIRIKAMTGNTDHEFDAICEKVSARNLPMDWAPEYLNNLNRNKKFEKAIEIGLKSIRSAVTSKNIQKKCAIYTLQAAMALDNDAVAARAITARAFSDSERLAMRIFYLIDKPGAKDELDNIFKRQQDWSKEPLSRLALTLLAKKYGYSATISPPKEKDLGGIPFLLSMLKRIK